MLSKLKETGIKYSFAIAFNRIVPERLFRFRRFEIFELPPVVQNGQHGNPTSLPKFATTVDEEQLASELTGYFRDPENKSCKAAVLAEKAEVVAAIWINENSFTERELGLRMELEPGHRWLNSAYVRKDFRKRGLYRELLSFVTKAKAQSNSSRFLLAINPDNQRSMAAHRSLGAIPIARVTAWRILSYARVSAKSKSLDWSATVRRDASKDCEASPTVVHINLKRAQKRPTRDSRPSS